MPNVDKKIEICYNNHSLTCVQIQREDFGQENLSDLCGTYCPERCSDVFYSRELSFADYPNTYYTNIIAGQSNLVKKYTYNTENFNTDRLASCYKYNKTPEAPKFIPKTTTIPERIKAGTMMLRVYYNELTFTSIKESPVWTIETLLGVIGGQLGLLCGK